MIYKNMVTLLPPFQFVALRAFFAALCSLLFLTLYVKRVTRQEIAAGAVLGGILAAAGVVQTYGIQATSAGNCAFLTGTNVVMVPFFSWILTKKKVSLRCVMAALIMFAGVCVLTVDIKSVGSFNRGDALSFAGAVLFAIHIAATEFFTLRVRPLSLVSLQFIFLFLFHLPTLPYIPEWYVIPSEAWIPMGYLGIVCIFAGHSIQIICQEKTDATKAAIILSLEGVFGSLFSVMFLGERYAFSALFAFLMIFASIILSQTQGREAKTKHNTVFAQDSGFASESDLPS